MLKHKALKTAAIVAAAAMISLSVAVQASAQTTQEESQAIWKSLKPDVFGDKPIAMADPATLQVIAPKRAQDAGIVPVDIAIPASAGKSKVVAVTLIVDANPSPLAAVFKIGEESGVSRISTRLRINDYSFVRAIAETESGELLMSETYVKATGGCSAPAVRDPKEAKATMGIMKLKQFPPQQGAAKQPRRELQLMVRHPNHSGFQMDQITRYYIPPHFINKVNITQGGRPILSMEGGISISEDPNFRFDTLLQPAGDIEIEATDTKGTVFRNEFPLEATGL
ncbi:MAG: quinoprotein dehydrogenase-associated SoxYZ-like carrier [Aestuariivirga sp.]